MQFKQKPLLQFNNISLRYGEKVILNGISGSITTTDTIGLLGINGSGKTSLLKVLTNHLKPNSGSIHSNARIEYLPQLDLEMYKMDKPLYKYLKEKYEEWWDVLTKYKEMFGTSLNENQSVATLSGGELVKIHLSLVLAPNPDLVFLDEPTNHLDLNSLKELEKILRNINISYIIVSHNTNFLNQTVDIIWELERGKLKNYGGNYDFYKHQKKQALKAKQRKYTAKKKEIKKLENARKKEQKRAQRSQRTGRKLAKFGGTDGFAQTFFKDRSEKSAGTNSSNLQEKKEKLKDEMQKYKVQKRKKAFIDFNTETKNGLVIQINKGSLSIEKSLNLINKISFSLYHGDRVAILGNNGSGKTTFVKQLAYQQNLLLKGEVKYGKKYKTLYVDQKYDVVNPELTVIENIHKNNSKINYENARRILGNLRFPMHYDVDKKAVQLSGGETARLAFAIANSSEIDLLVLDEPTNNLDIETIEVIIDALIVFKGTVVVISHDISFLRRVNIETIFEIKNRSLNKMELDRLNFDVPKDV
jgi:ATPase subunit of ABC transporter with duplicated ATPase domains